MVNIRYFVQGLDLLPLLRVPDDMQESCITVKVLRTAPNTAHSLPFSHTRHIFVGLDPYSVFSIVFSQKMTSNLGRKSFI